MARIRISSGGFQMLSKEAQDSISKNEHTVICLMVLIAITSIIWSISINILSEDFYNGIVGAKLEFRERDFTQMDERTKEIFRRDLDKIINDTYTETEAEDSNKKGGIVRGMQAVPEQKGDENTTQTSKKPKVRKIPHLFQISSNVNVPDKNNNNDLSAVIDSDDEDDDATSDDLNVTAVAKKFDIKADREFLTKMTIDMRQTRWRPNTAVQFIYSFPFLSEIIAIIWTAMCLIFQSSIKKYWGLPKPWRIVIPSILVFSLMSLSSVVYTILAHTYLKNFCRELRENLSNPNAISCGQAISILRPLIRQHALTHDVYLNLFRISYLLTLILWILALLVMVLRYILAIDFQLVDILPTTPEVKLPRIECTRKESETTEVLLSSPQNQAKLLQIDERHKSEDDFQSAKSHLSEVATPLLEQTQAKIV